MPEGIIYEMSMDILDDEGCAIRRERWAPVIINELKRVFHRRLRIDCETGISDDPTLNPQMIVQFSDNNGRTWSTERSIALGQIGNYYRPAELWRLGYGRSRIYRLIQSDAYPLRIADAYVEVEEGLS